MCFFEMPDSEATHRKWPAPKISTPLPKPDDYSQRIALNSRIFKKTFTAEN
jgi:hypothetical protein